MTDVAGASAARTAIGSFLGGLGSVPAELLKEPGGLVLEGTPIDLISAQRGHAARGPKH